MAVDVEELYRTYGPMVLRRCRALLRDEDKSLDALQEVFVKVLKRREMLTAHAPSSLLYTIATNTCLNILRGERRRPTTSQEDLLVEIAGLDDPERQALATHLLDTIFGSELATTKTIAVLHWVDGLTLEETAKAVCMSVSGVRKRLRRLQERGLSVKER